MATNIVVFNDINMKRSIYGCQLKKLGNNAVIRNMRRLITQTRFRVEFEVL